MNLAILSSKLLMVSVVAALSVMGLTTTQLRADDTTVTAQMRDQIESLRQRLNATSDSTEQAALRRELDQLIDRSLAELSESSRPMMAVMLKIVTPLQADNAAYTRAASAFFNSPNAALETIKSRDDIAARAQALSTLASANERLLKRLESLNGDVSNVLGDSRLTPSERMAIRSTLVQQFYPTRNVRDLESKIYTGFQSAMALLDHEWGHWHLKPEGDFTWDDPAASAKFKALTDEIQSLADRQMIAQVKLRDVR